MSIKNPNPVPCPGQPAISLDLIALKTLTMRNGDGILIPPSLTISFAPYATGDFGGTPGYIYPPNTVEPSFTIDNIYEWVATRAAAGDNGPAEVLTQLTQLAVEEYIRRLKAE